MSVAEKYPQEIEKVLAKYPPEQKRSAVMALLYMAQREEGYVSKADKADIAQILDMTTTEISAIVGFYSLYHDKKAGKYRIQVCTDIGCALKGADQYLADLCEKPLGPADFLEIARRYHTLVMPGIPRMGPSNRNEAKRFVTLIDALYEHKVNLICSAETSAQELYMEGDGSFEFERTVSRLLEMQSDDYMASPHNRVWVE